MNTICDNIFVICVNWKNIIKNSLITMSARTKCLHAIQYFVILVSLSIGNIVEAGEMTTVTGDCVAGLFGSCYGHLQVIAPDGSKFPPHRDNWKEWNDTVVIGSHAPSGVYRFTNVFSDDYSSSGGKRYYGSCSGEFYRDSNEKFIALNGFYYDRGKVSCDNISVYRGSEHLDSGFSVLDAIEGFFAWAYKAAEEIQKEQRRVARKNCEENNDLTSCNAAGIDALNINERELALKYFRKACDFDAGKTEQSAKGCFHLAEITDNHAEKKSLYQMACRNNLDKACGSIEWMYFADIQKLVRQQHQERIIKLKASCDAGNIQDCRQVGLLALTEFSFSFEGIDSSSALNLRGPTDNKNEETRLKTDNRGKIDGKEILNKACQANDELSCLILDVSKVHQLEKPHPLDVFKVTQYHKQVKEEITPLLEKSQKLCEAHQAEACYLSARLIAKKTGRFDGPEKTAPMHKKYCDQYAFIHSCEQTVMSFYTTEIKKQMEYVKKIDLDEYRDIYNAMGKYACDAGLMDRNEQVRDRINKRKMNTIMKNRLKKINENRINEARTACHYYKTSQ